MIDSRSDAKLVTVWSALPRLATLQALPSQVQAMQASRSQGETKVASPLSTDLYKQDLATVDVSFSNFGVTSLGR